MPVFDDRQRGEETKFALDAERQFKATARRNKLLGLWAAELMGLDDERSKQYAAEVVTADFEESGDEDVVRKVVADLDAKGVSVTGAQVRAKLSELELVAREQILAEG